MSNDGIRRVIGMRIEELENEVLYLTDPKVNPPSRHEGETLNEYANGMVARINNHEIEFLKKLFKLVDDAGTRS
jgi:chemotaxis signal transduction protein